jgi:hypothetical protein
MAQIPLVYDKMSKTKMKKKVYISAFIFLGILVQFLIHAGVEVVYIQLLLSQYEIFGLGLSFSSWFLIHNIFAALLLVVGVFVGYRQGKYWWRYIYEERKRSKK